VHGIASKRGQLGAADVGGMLIDCYKERGEGVFSERVTKVRVEAGGIAGWESTCEIIELFWVNHVSIKMEHEGKAKNTETVVGFECHQKTFRCLGDMIGRLSDFFRYRGQGSF
jgi:hypothetical protein